MAAELHDGVSQRLASLSFHLSAATAALAELSPEPAHTNDPVRFALTQLQVALELNQLAADDVRSAISGLGLRCWTTWGSRRVWSACAARSVPMT